MDWVLTALRGVPGATEIVVAPVGEVSKEVAILHQARNVEINVASASAATIGSLTVPLLPISWPH